MISNSSYRSGAVRSLPDSEVRRVSEVRSGGAQDHASGKSVSLIRVKPSVRIVVRDGKLEVVSR